jgi:hypothetical protein
MKIAFPTGNKCQACESFGTTAPHCFTQRMVVKLEISELKGDRLDDFKP